MFWPCETRTSTCRNFATISSGVYRFFGIAVLLHVKRHSSGRTTSKGEDHLAGASELSDVQALTGCPRTPAASRTLRPGFSPLSAFRPLSSLLRCRRTRSSSLAPLRLSAPAVRQAEASKTAKRACLTKKNLAAGGAGVFGGRLAKEG